MSKPQTQIPTKEVVRVVSVFVLAAALFTLYIAWVAYPFNLWISIAMAAVSLSAIGLSTISLVTGDKDWLLLGLIISPW